MVKNTGTFLNDLSRLLALLSVYSAEVFSRAATYRSTMFYALKGEFSVARFDTTI